MQQGDGLQVWQQVHAQVTHAEPISSTSKHCENSDLPPQLRGYLEETGEDGGCTYGRLYSQSVDQTVHEPVAQHAQQPVPSQNLDGALAALPRESQQSPPRLRENMELETAGRSAFRQAFEALNKTVHVGNQQQSNTLHPSPNSTNSAGGREVIPLMLQRYIDHESGKDGGSVYARLFETLDSTLKSAA